MEIRPQETFIALDIDGFNLKHVFAVSQKFGIEIFNVPGVEAVARAPVAVQSFVVQSYAGILIHQPEHGFLDLMRRFDPGQQGYCFFFLFFYMGVVLPSHHNGRYVGLVSFRSLLRRKLIYHNGE